MQPCMRVLFGLAAVVLFGCGKLESLPSPTGGGAGGSGGTGGAGGGSGNAPIGACTPNGFATAPSNVELGSVPGLASALDQRAYAAFLRDGGMGEFTVRITLEDDFSRDGGAKVPNVVVRFNGCVFANGTDVPGVGREFTAPGAAVWKPAPDRFVAYEVVDGAGALLYRRTAQQPGALPAIASVVNPTGPMATVSFAPVPDAGVDRAYLSAYRRIGTGGLQSTGIYTNPPIHTGQVTFPVTNQTNQFQLELQSGPIRLVSVFDTP